MLLYSTGAFAIGNIYLDGMGAVTQTYSAHDEFGGGGGLLYQLSDDFNFFFKNIFNKRKIAIDTLDGRKYDEYSYNMTLCGLQYLFNINKLPLFWTGSLGIGAGSVNIKNNYGWNTSTSRREYLTDKSDTGLCMGIWTGAMYVFTQSISAYMDIGFHKTYLFNDLKDEKIMGFQVILGVRFTLWGVNKSIYSEY
jgi:hypothetical protein